MTEPTPPTENSQQDTQPHCPTCRMPVEPHVVVDLLDQVDKLLDAVIAIGLHMGVEGFEEDDQ